MKKCIHCSALNRNECFCKQCGRRLIVEQSTKVQRKHEVCRTDFLKEVIALVETNFPSGDLSDPLLGFQSEAALNMTDFVKEDGLLIIGGYRLREPINNLCGTAFFKDMALTVLVPLISMLIAATMIQMPLINALKVYFVIYLMISFVVWFLFPAIFESSPVAFMIHNMIIIKGAVKRISKDPAAYAILWIFSLVYAFFPVLILEYVICKNSKQSFAPFMFQIAGVKYLQKIQ